jgi:hypothetical protein
MALIQFAFIVLVPVVLVAGAVVGLFALGALLDALDHPEELRGRIEAAFRRPPAAPRDPGPEHYYKPYWASRS